MRKLSIKQSNLVMHLENSVIILGMKDGRGIKLETKIRAHKTVVYNTDLSLGLTITHIEIS